MVKKTLRGMFQLRAAVFSWLCAAVLLSTPLSAFAEAKEAHLQYGFYASSSGGVYVDPGHTLHIYATNYSNSKADIDYKVHATNGAVVTQGHVTANGTKAYSRNVPVGTYHITLYCVRSYQCNAYGKLSD